MYLTPEQQAILNGSKGETMAKVMKTLVMYGETFGADKMVPVTSEYNHLVTSFGLKMMKPVFDLMQQLIDAGAVSGQKFSVDPRPLDKNVPANFLQNFIFNNFMYSKHLLVICNVLTKFGGVVLTGKTIRVVSVRQEQYLDIHTFGQ